MSLLSADYRATYTDIPAIIIHLNDVLIGLIGGQWAVGLIMAGAAWCGKQRAKHDEWNEDSSSREGHDKIIAIKLIIIIYHYSKKLSPHQHLLYCI